MNGTDRTTLSAYGHKMEIRDGVAEFLEGEPDEREKRRTLEWLEAEGFIARPPKQEGRDLTSKGIKIRFLDGPVEFYQEGSYAAAMLDPKKNEVFLILNGRTLTLENVKAMDVVG